MPQFLTAIKRARWLLAAIVLCGCSVQATQASLNATQASEFGTSTTSTALGHYGYRPAVANLNTAGAVVGILFLKCSAHQSNAACASRTSTPEAPALLVRSGKLVNVSASTATIDYTCRTPPAQALFKKLTARVQKTVLGEMKTAVAVLTGNIKQATLTIAGQPVQCTAD